MRPLGQLLLSKVLETGDFATLLRSRIDPMTHFIDPVEQGIFETIRTHYYSHHHFGEVPSLDLIKDMYPEFEFTPPDDSVESLCDQIKYWTAQRQLVDMGNRIIEYSEEPDYALSFARDQIGKVFAQYTSSRDVNFADSAEQLVEDLRAVREGKGMLGLPFPWPSLNTETMGMQPGDFIMFYGRPKNMKTWTVIEIAIHAYIHANARVLILTRELTERNMRVRLAARLCQLDYRAFKRQSLHPADVARFEDQLLHLKEEEEAIFEGVGKHKALIVTDDLDDPVLGGSVISLQTKIEQYEPDLVIIDPLYKMKVPGSKKPDSNWENQYQISHDIKHTARLFEIPIVCTNQAKVSAEKTRGQNTAEQAYADAFTQDCDLSVRVIKEKKEEGIQLSLIIAAAREIDMAGLVIHGNPATDFSEIRLLQEDEQPEEGGDGEPRKRRPRQTQDGTSRFGARLRKRG